MKVIAIMTGSSSARRGMKVIERRLAKLEARSGIGMRLPVTFVSWEPRERALPDTATVGGHVWHREPDEPEAAFLERVADEARLMRPGGAVLAFLD
jgi:hypothetical protein